MKISLQNASKKFNKQWIFRELSLAIGEGRSFAVLGANGSGKSTLLKCIAGLSSLTSGRVTYESLGIPVKEEQIFERINFCSPAQELIEEFTLREFLNFHFGLRERFIVNSNLEFAEHARLEKNLDKCIRDFSSGMKQRLKLALCFFTKSSMILLDEPCTNLDVSGVELYREWIREYTHGRTVIVASNILHEYEFCEERVMLS